MKMPSVMEHSFAGLPSANIPRSAFQRKYSYKTTFDVDYLIPYGGVDHVMPGDTIKFKSTIFARMSTPIYPLMDNLYLDTFHFFVPYRIVWSNFRKFMGERIDPSDSISYTVPTISSASGGFVTGTLADYFGLPVDSTLFSGQTLTVMSLPFRAYNLIWNEWFRDQGIQDSITVDTGDGPDTLSDYVLKKRCKLHDYFTSSRPWPQRGDAVSIPLTGDAPVTGIGKLNTTFTGSNSSVKESGGNTPVYADYSTIDPASANKQFYIEEDPDNAGYPNIYANLSDVTAATINDIREAVATQQLLERDARYGTRYPEIIESHFGVKNPMEAYRPQFLGGDSVPVMVTPVMQTESSDASTPQGTLAGYATATNTKDGFTFSATEHGMIISLLNVRADITYQQGIDRFWKKSTRYDFYFPVFAHLGEQETYNYEIYAQGTAADNTVFGYNERWSEYRFKNSLITGQFKSSHATSLDPWHLSEDLGTLPVLSGSFITSNTPMARVTAVPSEPDFVLDSFIVSTAVRPMPTYSTPGLERF